MRTEYTDRVSWETKDKLGETSGGLVRYGETNMAENLLIGCYVLCLIQIMRGQILMIATFREMVCIVDTE